MKKSNYSQKSSTKSEGKMKESGKKSNFPKGEKHVNPYKNEGKRGNPYK